MARPSKSWDERDKMTFQNLCGIFATQKEICQVMGITKPTLAKRIAEAYPDTPTWEEAFEAFSSTGKISIRRKQMEMALEGDKTMLIWLGKNYLGQSETGIEQETDTQSRLEMFRVESRASA